MNQKNHQKVFHTVEITEAEYQWLKLFRDLKAYNRLEIAVSQNGKLVSILKNSPQKEVIKLDVVNGIMV